MSSANFYLLAVGAAFFAVNVFLGEAIAARIAGFFGRVSVSKPHARSEPDGSKVEKNAPVA
jgi:hypothetical protein